MSDASKYASQRVFDGKRLLSSESVAKLRASYERADAMSDDRRSLIVGNLPEETVAALKDARMPDDAMSEHDANADPFAKHEYPSNYRPGTHWATDAAWEILDTIPPGVIWPDVRAFLAGQIAGRLMRERGDAT